jgi:phosphoribosylanthranilate isomerase
VTRIKICGLSETEHVLAAAAAGADFVGLVFAPSRRRVAPDKAFGLVEALRRLKTATETVGVFAGFPAVQVNRIADYCGLDRVQLSGGESWEFCTQIDRPIIKTVHISPQSTGDSLLRAIEEGRRLLQNRNLVFLLDTRVGTASGGTGQTFDWRLAKEVGTRFPVVVAGGLTPVNVTRLVREVQPWAVDVSSGVETLGNKDTAKIDKFIEAVRRAELPPQ